MTQRISTCISLFLFCFTLVVYGCAKQNEQSDAGNKSSKQQKLEPLSSLTPAQEKQKELALSTRDELFKTLSGELMTSMSENGPAKSIKVCKTRAPEVAAKISEETGVRIGRTSFKLRNTENQPPDWAKPYVEERVEKEIVVELPDQELGALLPIRLKAACVMCHGTNEQVTPDVKAAIAANYPDDQATGFKENDLRGYFWVEVAKIESN